MIQKEKAMALFSQTFGEGKPFCVFSHGRLEIVGNHTDHNHGLCLVGSCDLGITAAVEPRLDGIVCIKSEGFKVFSFSIHDLTHSKKEEGTSLGIVKGILFRMKELGFAIQGFNAALSSDIVSGSGVSSSACFESLIVKIEDHLCNNDSVPPLTMAKIGQFAENVYFGKPSGLLDQVGTSYGGVAFLDFGDMDNVIVDPMKFDLPLDVTLVQTPSSHANLTPLYASIPSDMKSVARIVFGKEVLRDVDARQFAQKIAQPCEGVSERAKLRAQHFFDENARVLTAKEAILHHQTEAFLDAIRGSEASSETLLANTMPPGIYQNSPQQAIDYAKTAIQGGACRIMGGGFAGSILCFTLKEQTPAFRDHMEKGYGASNVHPVTILPTGPTIVQD